MTVIERLQKPENDTRLHMFAYARIKSDNNTHRPRPPHDYTFSPLLWCGNYILPDSTVITEVCMAGYDRDLTITIVTWGVITLDNFDEYGSIMCNIPVADITYYAEADKFTRNLFPDSIECPLAYYDKD